jgi:hypothetical protein
VLLFGELYPRSAAAFYTAGPGALLKEIAAFLKALPRRGFLSIKGPELAAEQLAASRLGSLVLITGMVVTSSNCPCPVTYFVGVLRSSSYTMPPAALHSGERPGEHS